MSGIYKSRLFNFLNRQRIRFSNQLGITLRHLQLATETGAKFLLYPVYIIARTSISVRQQLNSKVASSQEFELTEESESQLPTTQIKVSRENTSRVDDICGEEGANNLAIDTSNSDTSYNSFTQPEKKSLFSNLLERLGLLSSNKSQLINNHYSDISTTELSEHNLSGIQLLIRKAIAYFFGNKKPLLSGQKQESLPSDKSLNSETIQLFQTNLPKVNSSQSKKSRLSLLSQVSYWLEKVTSTISPSDGLTTKSSEQDSLVIQLLIRRAIAHFFSNKKPLLSGQKQESLPSAQSLNSETIQLFQTNLPKVNSSQSKKPWLSLLSQVSCWLEKVTSTISASDGLTTELSEQDSFVIQVLIRKAIAYFFGNKQVAISSKINSNFSATLPFSSLNLTSESNSLSFTLPVKSWNLKLPSCPEQDFPLLDSSLTQDNKLFIIEDYLSESSAISHNIGWKNAFIDNNFSWDLNPNLSYSVTTANFSLVSLQESETLTNIPLEFSSDLWEAEVITVGYVKNILEIILEFLDKVTWLLEKKLLLLWQFVQKILILGKSKLVRWRSKLGK